METPPFGGRDVCSAVGGVKDSSVLWVMVELVGRDAHFVIVDIQQHINDSTAIGREQVACIVVASGISNLF